MPSVFVVRPAGYRAREGIGSRLEPISDGRGDGAHAAGLVRVITTPDTDM
jgi:hypothetical protein